MIEMKKRGLSTVVTTLIIILLVFASIGIIWGVVSNLLETGKKRIEYASSCFDVEIRAIKVEESSDEHNNNLYNIILQRTSGGDSRAIFAKFILYNENSNSELTTFQEDNQHLEFYPLDVKKSQFSWPSLNPLPNATKIEVTPYLLDEKGEEFICATTTVFKF